MASVTLTDEQRETVLLAYAQTGSKRAAARKADCSEASVRRIIADADAETVGALTQMRAQKRVDLAETLGDVEIALARALMDPRKIAEAPLDKVAVALGIVIDKRQLVTGKPTTRNEQVAVVSQMSAEEKEQARQFRERMLARQTQDAAV